MVAGTFTMLAAPISFMRSIVSSSSFGNHYTPCVLHQNCLLPLCSARDCSVVELMVMSWSNLWWRVGYPWFFKSYAWLTPYMLNLHAMGNKPSWDLSSLGKSRLMSFRKCPVWTDVPMLMDSPHTASWSACGAWSSCSAGSASTWRDNSLGQNR